MTDLLVLAPHPDDAEIHMGGTIAAHVARGQRVVIIDATRGELGSRGTPAERATEAAAAAAVLGVALRENLGLPDGGLSETSIEQRNTIVACLRRHQPRVVIALSGNARHPDHLALAGLAWRALKASELHGLRTDAPAHRGMRLWYAEAELRLTPDFLVPLTAADWERKLAAVRCYRSQLHQPGASGPETSIAQPDFLTWIDDRGRAWSRDTQHPFAEAFARACDIPRVYDLSGI